MSATNSCACFTSLLLPASFFYAVVCWGGSIKKGDAGRQDRLMARWLRCLHCRLTARRSWVQFPHGLLLVLGGRSSTDLQCSGGLSPGPFCVEFACSPSVHKGFPPLRTPTEKICKRTEHMSIPDQRWTVHFTWSPGATSCPLLLGGP